MIYVLAQRMTLLVPCDSQIIAYYYFTYKLPACTMLLTLDWCDIEWFLTLTFLQHLWKVTLSISTAAISLTTGQITHKYI